MRKFIYPIIFILFFLLKEEISAQSISAAVQQGHFNEIIFITGSPDGKTIATFGKDQQIIIWDLNTGMQLKRNYYKEDSLQNMKYISEESIQIFGINSTSQYNLITNQIQSKSGKEISPIEIIKDDKYVYSINGPVMHVLENGKIIQEKTTQYFDKGYSSLVANSYCDYIFASSKDGYIYVYDKKRFKEIKLLKLHRASVNGLFLSKDGQSLYSISKDRSIIEWNTKTLELTRRFNGFSFRITSLSLSEDENSIYYSNELGQLCKFELDKFNSVLENKQIINYSINKIIGLEKDSLLLIAGQNNRIHSYNLKSGKIKKSNSYHKLSWRKTQQNIFENVLSLYSEPMFTDFVIDYSSDQESYAYFANEKNSVNRKKIIYHNKKLKIKKNIRSSLMNVSDIEVINDTLIAALRFMPKVSNFKNFTSGLSLSFIIGNEMEIWKIKGNNTFRLIASEKPIAIESFHNRYLFCLENTLLIIWDLKNNSKKYIVLNNLTGTPDGLFIKDSLIFISSSDNSILVYKYENDNEVVYQSKLMGHEGKITDVICSKKQDLIITSSDDATIRFWNLKTYSHLNTLIPVGKHDFIFLNTKGEYQITKKALRKFGFTGGLNFIYPDQLDLKFNKPHSVLASLGVMDSTTIEMLEKAYHKRLKRMGFEEKNLTEQTELPELTIVNQKLIGNKVELEVHAKDKKHLLNRINIYVNDVPVYGSKGYSVESKNSIELNEKILVELLDGKNKVELSVLNTNGVESLRKSIILQSKNDSKPNLYVLSIGTSEYDDKRFNLTYASKDAIDLSKLLQNNSTSLYQNVYSKTITDSEFTKTKLSECSKFFSDAKANDMVILFLAGHGVLDKNLDYYLATYNMNFSIPSENGLPYEELESLLDGIAPLKKVLFLDACHSGEIDKEEVEQLATNTVVNSKVKYRDAGTGIQKKNLGLKTTSELMGELFTDLRRGTGATVISSAGGVESAMESDEWKNGLFTYCLLHGLKDKVADTNKDGEIWLSELQSYLRKEVTELSNGAQQPTSRIENLSMDFRVW